MSKRADAHIHLFRGGFQGGSFTARPGVQLDEVACYTSLARDHGVAAALVVGYAASPWCADNTDFLAETAKQHAWVKPLAFAHPQSPLSCSGLETLARQGFVGLSFYIFSDDDVSAMARVPAAVWSWLEEKRWLISVNSRGANWRQWIAVLKHHAELRLVMSHLGLPLRQSAAPAPDQARRLLDDVLALARFPQVLVKLSGFYALSDPGHDYPHRAAWPYVQCLRDEFTARRLLWASDFSPCLDCVSFPQTLGVLGHMPFLSAAERSAIEGENLLALLAQVSSSDSAGLRPGKS